MIRVITKRIKRVLPVLIILFATTHAVIPRIAGRDRKTSVTERAAQLVRAGEIEPAVQLLQSTLAVHPQDLEARVALGNIYAGNHQAEKAELEFREALHLHPESSSAALALAAFYVNSGSPAAAEQLLNDTVHRHPDLTAGHAALALVLAMEHKYAKAKAQIRLVPPPAESNARARHFRLV